MEGPDVAGLEQTQLWRGQLFVGAALPVQAHMYGKQHCA